PKFTPPRPPSLTLGGRPSPRKGRVKKSGLALPISLSNSRHASSPLFFDRPGVSRIASFRIAPGKSTEGARDACGSDRTHGPRHLATSRLRRPPSRLRVGGFCPQVRQSQGVPRAVFVR